MKDQMRYDWLCVYLWWFTTLGCRDVLSCACTSASKRNIPKKVFIYLFIDTFWNLNKKRYTLIYSVYITSKVFIFPFEVWWLWFIVDENLKYLKLLEYFIRAINKGFTTHKYPTSERYSHLYTQYLGFLYYELLPQCGMA